MPKPVHELKILIVDDQKSMRALARMYLSKIGFADLHEAEDASEAKEKIKALTLDAAIFDWNMEGMSGVDLLKWVRSESSQRMLPVLMATSESDSKKVHEAIMAGANQYVIKPFDENDLRRRLEQLFRRPLKAAA
jgi:two-component system, chemotaxis family, chemotaxis protein CheY